jgi:hypothetical protein
VQQGEPDAFVGAYRCFFRSDNGSEPDMLVYGNGVEEQGISTFIRTVDTDGTEHYYDLNGRRLNGKPTSTGVYINNGKKVIIK